MIMSFIQASAKKGMKVTENKNHDTMSLKGILIII